MSNRARTGIALSLTFALALSFQPAAMAASPEPVKAEHGMVVTAQHLASDVGVEVLKEGGNAVDAAVAVGYALAVVYPTAGNIGGGGFMTIRLKDGKTTFLDFRERAPLASTKTMYLDDKGNIGQRPEHRGYLAVGVPGSVMGFETARKSTARKSREKLMAPAIRFARDGFVLEQGDVASSPEGEEMLAKDKAAAAIFLKPDGKPYAIGETLVQPDLAATLSAHFRERSGRLLQRRDRRRHRQGQRGERRHSRQGRFRAIFRARTRAGEMQLSRL